MISEKDVAAYSLGELIACLERYDPQQRVAVGFGKPMSYRGYYDELAFEPMENTTVGEMLVAAKSALGETFGGYKGGDFTMTEHVDVWIACYGQGFGQKIGALLMRFMLGEPPASGGQDAR